MEGKVKKEMLAVAEEVLRTAKEVRMPIYHLAFFSRRIKKAKAGEIHFSEAVVPLIEKTKTAIRGSKRFDEIEKEYRILLLEQKKNSYFELLKELIFTSKGK